MELTDLVASETAVGKGAVFYAPTAWDFASNLHASLFHLGFLEGELTLPFNETFNSLTLPEYTGEAEHLAFVQGEAPVATLPLYVANPALRAILSPTGVASGGFSRQRPVTERTLVIVPEQLFVSADPAGQVEAQLVPTGSGWTLNGVALNAAQTALLGKSVFLWRGYFKKPQYRFVHEGGGKLVEPVEFVCMFQSAAPNGHRLYTLGDPYEASIDLLSGVLES
jgi:hypothetical protein